MPVENNLSLLIFEKVESFWQPIYFILQKIETALKQNWIY